MSDEAKSEFWRRHLAGVENPLVHFLPSNCLHVEVLEKASGQLGFAFFLIDTRHVQSVSVLMKELAKAMDFPNHFGHNWDALLDLTRDLSWNQAKGYVLTLSNAGSLLHLANNEFSLLLRVLEATVREWRDEQGEYGKRTAPIPFHVVFSGSDLLRAALLKQLKEPLCDHEADLSVRVIRTVRGASDTESFGDAKKLIQGGAELELVLSFLRERGVGRIDSVYAMANLMEKPVSEARALVNRSQTWSDRYETDMRFRNAAREALRDLGFS
jgi:RNAse (barnase) inhibitor barstar